VAATGGEPVQLTRKGGIDPFESPDGKFVYYTKSTKDGYDPVPGLWRVPVGGEEALVIKEVRYRAWAVLAEAIYFISLPNDHEGKAHQDLEFFSFATNRAGGLSPSTKNRSLMRAASVFHLRGGRLCSKRIKAAVDAT
jgi:hypothetical protein